MIRVLLADDSKFMQKSIRFLLESDPSISVAGTASDGAEALKMVSELDPDVVILDIEMPVMDGLSTLSRIMESSPKPVLILTGLKDKTRDLAMISLERGAVDFISKPSGVISYDIDLLKTELIRKVRIAAGVKVHRIYQDGKINGAAKKERHRGSAVCIIIGASTGGPRAIASILGDLPVDIDASVIIVQHMESEFISSFARRMNDISGLPASVAVENEDLQTGRVYIAPGGENLRFERDQRGIKIRISEPEPDQRGVPSIDIAMKSAADVFGNAAIGVLLTGMGEDGAEGLSAIRNAGGTTMAESERSCVIFGMPKAAIESGVVEIVVPFPAIAEAIMDVL